MTSFWPKQVVQDNLSMFWMIISSIFCLEKKNLQLYFQNPIYPSFFFMKIDMALFKEAPNHPNALPSHPDSILETSLVLKFSISIHQSRLGFFNDLFLRGYRMFRIVFSSIFWIEKSRRELDQVNPKFAEQIRDFFG